MVQYDVRNATKQQANGPCECLFRNWAIKLRSPEGNEEFRICFEKNLKTSALFLRKKGKKICLPTISQHDTQPDKVPPISSKQLAFPSSL